MIDQASGNPRWESANGRGVPALPAPAREELEGAPGGSVATWLGWCPTRWRAESSGVDGVQPRPAWAGRLGSGI
jgi:hypothetical protein